MGRKAGGYGQDKTPLTKGKIGKYGHKQRKPKTKVYIQHLKSQRKDFPGGPEVEISISQCTGHGSILVGEPRSCMLQCVAKKKKKKKE